MSGVPQASARPPATRVGSPPSILLTLLGDFWQHRPDPLPSGALVDLLSDFGVSTDAARAALSRLAGKGLLSQTRTGRMTGYRLSEHAVNLLDAGARTIFASGLPSASWDGLWRMLLLPRDVPRKELIDVGTQLRWIGFVSPVAGLWISPRDRGEDALSIVNRRGLDGAVLLIGSIPERVGQGDPRSWWQLETLAADYERFEHDALLLRTQALSGSLTLSEALVARTTLMDRWRVFPSRDPGLPEELLPLQWPGVRARATMMEVYDLLRDDAETRFWEVLARYSSTLARDRAS